ncbi:MAG: hypothetical protein NVSMB9_01390 [Isosphaeraceae bacterium]
MALTQTSISSVSVRLDGPELLISWDSRDPKETAYQVYVDHRLSWFGTSRHCHVPIPSSTKNRNIWVDVLAVSAHEIRNDFSSGLASQEQGWTRIRLSWLGGTYLDSSGLGDIRGFRVYRGTTSGGPVDLSTPVGEVPAYPGGWISDGFGLGGFGLGGFGRSASSYTWDSESLQSGTWQYTVVPFDKAGNNRGTGWTTSMTVKAAPRPPALSSDGTRLSYFYSGPAARQVTLNWLASPS